MIHDGVELTGVEASVVSTALIMLRILSQIALILLRIFSQIAHTVGLFLGIFLLLTAKFVVPNDIVQITDNRCAAYGLRMKSGNDAGDLFVLFVCIFMIQKELVGLPADDDAPLTFRCDNVKLTILQMAGHIVFPAEPAYGSLLPAKPHADGGAAAAHTVTGDPCRFRICERSLVRFANAAGDLAVRKVEYFLIAFDAVEYHAGQLLFSVCLNYTSIYVQ